MIPDEANPPPVDEQLLAEMMAFDALLHDSAYATERDAGPPTSPGEWDDRGRSRLLLLLKMLDATESSKGQPADASATAGQHQPHPPRPLLDRFDVLDNLGSGGFGFVVPRRRPPAGPRGRTEDALARGAMATDDVHQFLREARAAARLDHPNIVRVFDAGELGPLGYFIASEFCPGPSLRRWLKSQNQPVPARLARAGWPRSPTRSSMRMTAASSTAISSRITSSSRAPKGPDRRPDPSSVLQQPREGGGAGAWRPMSPADLVPRLTDFGLAKLTEEVGDESRSGIRIGTAPYMAPEQAAGRREEVGPATDVYALGATFYQILVGRTPFRGETEAETLHLVLESEPVAPRSLRPGLPCATWRRSA